eukprot:1295743-Ditylum_brightwellii.AAC.1
MHWSLYTWQSNGCTKSRGGAKQYMYHEIKTDQGVQYNTDWEAHYINDGHEWMGCPQYSI